jgi:hypothetical protein
MFTNIHRLSGTINQYQQQGGRKIHMNGAHISLDEEVGFSTENLAKIYCEILEDKITP